MESGDAGEPGLFFYDAVAALAWADDLNGAEAILDRAVARADERGLVLDAATARFRRAMVLYLQGGVTAAADDAREAISAAAAGWTVHLPSALGILALAQIELGQLDAAAESLERAAPPEGATVVIPEAISSQARATLYLVRGDPAAAATEAIAAGRILTESLGSPVPLVPWRSLAAAAHRQLGATAEAERLAAEEVQLARTFGAPRSLGVALRALGSIRGGAEGIALLREAADVLAASPARLEYARALGELGAALRRSGHADATHLLQRALELAEGCGAALLAGRLADELRISGERSLRRRAGAGTLTPAQERVARLAAGGLTNKQIAAQLYVSVAAVEFHLRNVFRKLGISSRRELGAALPPED
jgi:DNA-binding NarL/FixJ family response regulator